MSEIANPVPGGNWAEVPDDNLPALPTLGKVRYTHEAMIDEIVANPSISQGELARRFGYTQSWMSIIINSDSFQHALAERKAQFIDPKLQATVNDRLDSLARSSLDRLLERLDNNLPIATKDLVAMAKLGVGDKNTRPAGPAVQQNLYVVALPPRAENSKSWLAQSSRGVISDIETTIRG